MAALAVAATAAFAWVVASAALVAAATAAAVACATAVLVASRARTSSVARAIAVSVACVADSAVAISAASRARCCLSHDDGSSCTRRCSAGYTLRHDRIHRSLRLHSLGGDLLCQNLPRLRRCQGSK